MRRAPWSSILYIVNYCCTGVLLYACTIVLKNAQETESEETRLFCQIFFLGGISIDRQIRNAIRLLIQILSSLLF